MIAITKENQRLYFAGDTFAVKEEIRGIGGHFDGDRRQWWIGAAKRAAAEALVDKVNSGKGEPAAKEDLLKRDQNNILGRAKVHGRPYYIVGEGNGQRGPWIRLMWMDGSTTFFKNANEVEIERRYQTPKTLDGLQRFADQARAERTAERQMEVAEKDPSAISVSFAGQARTEGYFVGQVILNKGRRRGSSKEQAQKAGRPWDGLPDNDGPECLTVVTCSGQYIREDGLSFGLGSDSGYVFSAVCRPATPDEAAPVLTRVRREAERHTAQARLKEISRQIQTTGERPEGTHRPEGVQVDIQPNTGYGGGRWMVVGADFIWFVENHGSDGDNWSANNVHTGGAGAIGWRVPFNAELGAEIQTLGALLKA